MDYELLSKIDSPADLKELSQAELLELTSELRAFIIDVVSTKEGHLGASLGVVELTIALHKVFDTPEDLLVWDVGHQAYGHKILTGRRDVFETNRRLNGISGFPKRDESIYDTFGVGHSSTSISSALGMAIASQLKGDKEKQHIAVIGDASIAAGMAFEGLNHAGVTDANLLVILNDNAIGIDPSVGALKNYLTKAKIGRKPAQDNMIEALNFNYKGPIDGHDLPKLIETLEKLKQVKGPKFLHVITKKGKGLKSAEQDQVTYHAPGQFDKNTGELLPKDDRNLPPKFQDVFGLTLLELARENQNIVGITPAMPTGSSLKYMMQEMPNRAFDVGIAEQHAVTFSAGLATQGQKVFCTIYSTFLQRAYDQLIHDVALQNLPVVFCIDRAGLVGNDGATHHGSFDLAYLNCIPNMVIAAPSSAIELRQMLYTASLYDEHPFAIRYPRGRAFNIDWQVDFEKLEIGKAKQISKGHDIAILSLGSVAHEVQNAIKLVEDQCQPSHYDFRFLKPLDRKILHQIFNTYDKIITVEDGSVIGGFGSVVLREAQQKNYLGEIHPLGIPDRFIEHGSPEELYDLVGLSADKIALKIEEML
ncbi:1-deoxy-D-xylulose-5-phosphate synthase [Psychroflexus halocasei]|uniref:1-deoxy-D-xylulose-5-phosphate synthase n=1 Tax=Psychroflexus halocasei TaxID=908615 RepID=A0A1H3VYQ5_9FLAO|nr:1-deoxy-D-xylulose-5-phosphate synthase [Psychroflexus halocasei]SDZ79880.1 1-deoxy-D-xylulose-5-phosphate synthase [Psychroflexus halocasei]